MEPLSELCGTSEPKESPLRGQLVLHLVPVFVRPQCVCVCACVCMCEWRVLRVRLLGCVCVCVCV